MNTITHTTGHLANIKTFIQEHQPNLSKDEWMAICDVLNGGTFKEELGFEEDGTLIDLHWTTEGNKFLGSKIEDSEPDGLYEKWEIDGPALVKKLLALTEAEVMAVLHAVQIAWDCCEELPIEEGLAKAGISFPRP